VLGFCEPVQFKACNSLTLPNSELCTHFLNRVLRILYPLYQVMTMMQGNFIRGVFQIWISGHLLSVCFGHMEWDWENAQGNNPREVNHWCIHIGPCLDEVILT
jgi:hypothetical protein